MSSLEFLPIPQARDFDAAFTQLDAAVQRQGGVHTVVHGESDFSVADQEAFEQDIALSRYSTLFIPYEADVDDAHAYLPAHSFSRGFMLTKPVNDLLYSERYTFQDYYSSLNDWMTGQGAESITDDRRWYEANALLLEGYSNYGLGLVGETSKSVIERQAEALYGDPALARIFSFGCGAMVLCGVIHQRSVNDWAINGPHFSDNMDDELAKLMTKGE